MSIRTKNLDAGWAIHMKNSSCFSSGGLFFIQILLQMGGYGRKRYMDLKDVLQQIITSFRLMKLAA